MVRATITYLIAVPYRLNPTLIQPKPKRKSEKKKLDSEDVEEIQVEIDPHYIEGDPEMKYFCSISYKLLPSMDTTISIVCWGKIAKIFLKDQVLAVRTVLRNNTAWISFSICHKIKTIKLAQTPKILEHKAEFSIVSDDPRVLSSKAQSDSPQLYYSFKEGELIEDDDHEFEIIYPVDLTQSGEMRRQLTPKGKKTPKTIDDKYGTLIGIPSHLHRSLVKHQIDSSQFKLARLGLPLTVEQELEKIKRDKQKSKRKSISKKSKKGTETEDLPEMEEKRTLIITGDELLYDKIMWMKEQYSLSSDILYAGIWLTSDTLLNKEITEYYQPIGILLTHIENVPITDNSYRKCKKITIKYTLGNLFSNELPPITLKRPTSNIYIDNAKVYFTNTIPPEKLLECFQTNKLLIKIYGHLQISTQSYGAIFTQEPEDEFLSKRNQTKLYPDFDLKKKYSDETAEQHEELLEEVLLGCAEVNCCGLACGSFRINSNAPVMSGMVKAEETNTLNVVDNFNTLEVYDYKQTIIGALCDSKLIENNTIIKVYLKVLGPLITIGDYLSSQVYYTRMVIILRCTQKATQILKRLFSYNGLKLSNAGLIPCIPYYKGDMVRGNVSLGSILINESNLSETTSTHDIRFDEQERSYQTPDNQRSTRFSFDQENNENNLSDLITGFVIDELDQHIISVEGPSQVIDTIVWTQIADLKSSEGSVLYNSELIFTERLHEDFNSIGGIYVITMAMPIEKIFEHHKAFLAGYIPMPAWRALLSIRKLLKSKNMHMVIQEKLLPSCNELMCLDMEYGVPLYRNKLA